MSSLFHSPKTPKIPQMPSEPEPVTTVTEDAEDARRRERRHLLSRGGRQSTILSGIQSALKKRLGE